MLATQYLYCQTDYNNINGQYLSFDGDCYTISINQVNEEKLKLKFNTEGIWSYYFKADKGEFYENSVGYRITFTDNKRIEFNFESKSIGFRKISNLVTPTADDLASELACIANKKFPYTASKKKSDRIDGKSWRFSDINISLSKNGKLLVKAVQSTNRCEGFTGQLIFDLLDSKGNLLVRAYSKQQGLDTELDCDAEKSFNDVIEIDFEKHPEIIIGLHHINIIAQRSSSKKDVKYYVDYISGISDELSQIGTNIESVLKFFK